MAIFFCFSGLGLKSSIPKSKNTGIFFSEKYKKFFQSNFFVVFQDWESKVRSQNIRKFFLEKHKKVFLIGAGKFHPEIYKKNFLQKNIRNFFRVILFCFSDLRLESAPGSSGSYY